MKGRVQGKEAGEVRADGEVREPWGLDSAPQEEPKKGFN